MSVKIDQPYPVFRDKIGLPLDGGLIYIGVAGLNPETNPIQCYFDEDFTLTAPQPLRTINGYISRNGSPANIFLKVSECSITVKDKFKSTQYSDLHYQLSNFGELTSSSITDESGMTQQQVNNGLSSIAELVAIQNPKNGNTQFVKSLDGGYFTYNASKASINDGVIIYNGWVRITFETVYRSEWVGVTGIEGDDCVPKLKKLFEYVAAKGGGTCVVQDGVHSLNTVNVDSTDGYIEHYAFGMYNNVTIEGTSRDKTIFKVKNNLTAEAPQRWGLFVDNHRNDIVNFTAKNFKVDFNGYNNLCTETLQPVYVVALIWDAYTAKNIMFDNIWCDKNSTWNSFFIGTKCEKSTIQNCLFTEHSDSIPNNAIKDHSTIYINGKDARVLNCVFTIPENVVSYISTGIEAHGTNTICSGNIVNGYGAPFLSASTENNRHDDITFINNTAIKAQMGFAYNSLFGTLKTSFISNSIVLRKNKAPTTGGGIRYAHSAIESAGAINTIADKANSWADVYVLNNVFEQEEPTDWNDMDKYINACHSVKEARLFVSKGNTFKNFKGASLSVLVHRDILGAVINLDGNTYIGCGRSNSYSAYDSAYRLEGLPFVVESGFSYNLLDKISIVNEHFLNCSYGALLGRQDDLTARQINITNINYDGTFIPPASIVKPINLANGHTINIEYKTNGFTSIGQTLSDTQGLSGKIDMKHWSSTNVDDFILQNISYVKTPYYGWNLRALSVNIPSNSTQFGAFPNKNGDRIDAISASPSGFSSYVRSNDAWYGIGKLNTPI